MIKRIASDKEREFLKEKNKFKGKDEKTLSDKELRELIILIAKKLNLI